MAPSGDRTNPPPPAEPRRYGLLHVLVVMAAMTAFGAVLGVLLAHIGH